MQSSILFLTFTLLALTSGNTNAGAADSGWISVGALKRHLAAIKRNNEYPVKLECRDLADSPAVIKPSLRIVTRENAKDIEWQVLAYKDTREWKPGTIGQENLWRKVSDQVLRGGAGGTVYRCSLWYRK